MGNHARLLATLFLMSEFVHTHYTNTSIDTSNKFVDGCHILSFYNLAAGPIQFVISTPPISSRMRFKTGVVSGPL
jgi:hypothetical protein